MTSNVNASAAAATARNNTALKAPTTPKCMRARARACACVVGSYASEYCGEAGSGGGDGDVAGGEVHCNGTGACREVNAGNWC